VEGFSSRFGFFGSDDGYQTGKVKRNYQKTQGYFIVLITGNYTILAADFY